MPILSFRDPDPTQGNLLVALAGPSGSGKTKSALIIAQSYAGCGRREGVASKILLIDTEAGRGQFYAEEHGYTYAALLPPFSPERYLEALQQAQEAGFEVVIVDSASHEWAGIDGVVDMAEASSKKGLGKWAAPKYAHKRFMNGLLALKIPLIILCLRSKEKMVQRGSDIVSLGQQVVQEKEFAFEMSVQLLLTYDGHYDPKAYPPQYKVPGRLRPVFKGGQITEQTGVDLHAYMRKSGDELLTAATDIARQGTEAFREWWKSQPKPVRARLDSHKTDLQKICQEADS